MVTYEQLQSFMQSQAEQDRERTYVHVQGETVEDALRQAAIELGIPIRKLDYEVLEGERHGVLGVGKRPCSLLVYPSIRAADDDTDGAADGAFGDNDGGEVIVDGGVFIRRAPEGILLKVTPPAGGGKPATVRQAMNLLAERGIDSVDRALVGKIVEYADGQYVKIGEFDHNPANDSAMSMEIAEQEMKAYVTVLPPGPNGADPSRDGIVGFLKSHDVVHGFLENRLTKLEDEPVFREPVLVAEGTKPKNGEDAKVIYNFQAERDGIRLKEKNGRVDFKELNLIQNVVEGQVLARKKPAERGEAGRTVTGKMIPATDGADTEILAGKNVSISPDGMQATADINGQVVLTAGRLNVEPVYVVNGDVSVKTGNVLFLGTVMVKGSVDDGFSVKAAGNIEVMGSVGKCDMDAEGDIIVHQGIAGKGGGNIRAGKGLWAKFIENAHVESGGLVVVSDGIINSTVSSDFKVVCKGKRASIVGGQTRANEEVHAKTLGSVAGMETLIEVGYDPKSRARLTEVDTRLSEIEDELEDINLNLQTIRKIHKSGRKLTEDKMNQARQLQKRKNAITKEQKELSEEGEEVRNYLAQLRNTGTISAAGTVYPGVKIHIRDASLEVRNEFNKVSFVAEGGTVKATRYQDTEEDLSFQRKG